MHRMELTLRKPLPGSQERHSGAHGDGRAHALCDHEDAKAPEALCPLPWLCDHLLQGPGTPAEAAFCHSDLAANLMCPGSEARSHPHSPRSTEAERPLASSLGPGKRVLTIWRPHSEGQERLRGDQLLMADSLPLLPESLGLGQGWYPKL